MSSKVKKKILRLKESSTLVINEKSKELIFKADQDSIENEKLVDFISNGKVRFNKSDVDKKPCALYFIESGTLSLLVENCDKKAIVEIR